MDEFNNNNGQQGYDPNLYGQNDQQPNNMYGGQPQFTQYDPNMGQQSGESKGLSIAALVCGIVGLIACVINTWLTLILGIAAIVMGIIGRKKGGRSIGTAGMILGIVDVVLFVLLILFVVIVGVAALGMAA